MNRVWTYVISQSLPPEALAELKAAGDAFVSSWSAHENKLAASFDIFKNRILVVKVNEDVHGASGCSIDKLTRFIKETETRFGIELLNRFLAAYQSGNDVEVVHASKIKEMLAKDVISENTLIYNTAVANEQELGGWEQPLKNTWLSKYLVKA
jgi:hypothetical protein